MKGIRTFDNCDLILQNFPFFPLHFPLTRCENVGYAFFNIYVISSLSLHHKHILKLIYIHLC